MRVVAAGNEILDVASLAIGAGEHVAIVGASGAGKSSLVGLLLGWHRPAAGSVRVDGAPLDVAALEALRQQTAWVDPSVYLWNRPLAHNLAFGAAGRPIARRWRRRWRRPSSTTWCERLPRRHGRRRSGEAGALVSGGEGQRVRFGRGAARGPRPALVVLDEPFRGLDARAARASCWRARGGAGPARRCCA